MSFQKNKILIIGGPTASGKTEISFKIAKEVNGEIISCDSRQFYKEINIGTDKPPLWMRNEIPHYFVDFLSLKDEFDVFQYKNLVFQKVREIISRNKVPIIVGGSGFYIRTLLRGLFYLPPEFKEKQREIRERLEKETTEDLYEKLKNIDPEIAKKINKNDKYRIKRAIEIYEITGRNMSYWQKQKTDGSLKEIGKIFYFILFRDREEIYKRIKERIEKMFEKGWIDEVIDLKNKSYEKYLRTKAPIGYREILDFLEGKYNFEELKEIIFKRTKDYARKQIIWFKREEGEFINFKDENEVVNKILESFKND
ncbi:MAG: tRNA (adenosine(37)-N6)-dimethylallyltransferase MiaA [Candidatus Omnitrophica bacterium]|nr:tRNA (adenosine(37)-N6)-dimethylallyltransferase MiaA [Candidatus Omnitrophota bacterium]MCM8807305.1 tRNA (adenosine(37)-N6)-dimethylallyltransferase MiaA [Candidatus Omnitrophota bacterium]